MCGGGDTKRVVAVAGRRQRGWYGDGSGGGTERVAAVAWRGQWQWHREGGSGGMESLAYGTSVNEDVLTF